MAFQNLLICFAAVLCQIFVVKVDAIAGYGEQSKIARFGRRLQECNPSSNEGCEAYFMDDYPSPLNDEHKCEDYVRQDRGDERHVERMLITRGRQLEQQIVGRIQSPHNSFYYVKGIKPEQEFLFCVIPKTGVTRAKMLIMRMTNLTGHVHAGQGYKQAPYKFVKNLSLEKKQEVLFNPNIPRIKLVRNPYIRAISGYKDKIVLNNFQRKDKYAGWHMSFDKIPTFDEWVAQLYDNYKTNKFIDEHFATQYERCWQNIGFKFDYVLKVERMNYWYPCFLQELNLWQYMMKGWPGKDQCYFSCPDVPCNGPVQTAQGNLVSNSSIQGMDHQHDSVKMVKEFYKNETTARLVTEIFLNDIVQYNYPFWYEMVSDQYNEIV